MTRLSVVIPSYNHRRYLEAALLSLEEQTFRDFDVFVVDDGSSDDSVEVVQRFASRNSLTISIATQANQGAHAALNRGIQMSSGEVVAILNSDDLYHPRRLEDVLDAAPQDGPFVAFTEFEIIGEDGSLIPDDPHNIWYREALAELATLPSMGFMLIRSNISVSTSNYVFTRSLYDQVGPFRPFRTAHDLDFLLRCVPSTEPLFVRSPLLRYRIHGNNTINQNRDLERREVRTILNDYVEAVTVRPPRNSIAPGARQIPLYSEYFLSARDHWSGPIPDELRHGLAMSLKPLASGDDARALRLEVERLTSELRSANASRAALPELEHRTANVEHQLQSALRARTEAVAKVDELLASRSWRLTAPLRRIIETWRALIG